PARVSRAQGIARQRLPPSMDAGAGGMDAAVRPPDPNADPPNPEDGNAQRPYSLGPPQPPPPPPAPIAEPTLDGGDDRPYSMTGEDPDGEWMSGAAIRGERSAPHVPGFSRPQYGTNLAEFFAALESVNQVASRATPLIATYNDAVN